MSLRPSAGLKWLSMISIDVGAVESLFHLRFFAGRKVESRKADKVIMDETRCSKPALIGSRMRSRSAFAASVLILEHCPSHLVVAFFSPGLRHWRRHQSRPSR